MSMIWNKILIQWFSLDVTTRDQGNGDSYY